MFAFERWEDGVTANAAHGWPLQQVHRFRVLQVRRVLRVNMEIVSLARAAYRFMLDGATTQHIWRSYCEGRMDCSLSLPTADGVQPPGRDGSGAA